MKNLILPLIASVVLLVSCSKDDDSNNNPTTTPQKKPQNTPKLYKTVESYEDHDYINNKRIKTLVTETSNFTFGKNGYISSNTLEKKTIYKLSSKDSVSIKKEDKTDLIYNDKNQLIKSITFNEYYKDGSETFYKYDSNGNLIEEKEGNEYNSTSFYEYKNGVLVRSEYKDSGTTEITSYEYNNNVLKKTNENDKSYKLIHFDNKKNPFYLLMPKAFIKSRPAFASKHNVIKAERFNAKNEKEMSVSFSSFKYNSNEYPTEKISTTGRGEYKRVTKTIYFYK